MRRPKSILSLAILGLIVVGAWFVLPRNTETASVESTANSSADARGPLDGMTFTGALGPDGKPKDVPDTFVFANGTFVSKECEQSCKYPARPYFVRRHNDQTDFVSETKCPYKDAKIVWRGTVKGDTITGVSTWTVTRWYWTVEKNFEFAGKLAKQPSPAASTQ